MQLNKQECMVLAIMFFSSQVLGTMVNGAPVPQAALAQRAQTSASSSSSGGDPLGSLISGLAPFAEDLLPMLARDVSAKAPQDPESHAKAVAELSSKLVNDPTARAKLAKILATPSKVPAPVPATTKVAARQPSSGDPLGSLISGLAPFAEDLLPMLARDVSAKAPQDPESHAKAVAELSSKLVNDPTARSKLAQIIATPPATPVRAPVPSTKVAARAPQSSGDPLAGLIGTLAPFAEDLLPMLA
jgi:hypothetical protein